MRQCQGLKAGNVEHPYTKNKFITFAGESCCVNSYNMAKWID